MNPGDPTTPVQRWQDRLFLQGWTGRLWNLGKLGATVGIAQVIVQAVAFASGILVIRLLPAQEYAFYTLANTMLGMMTILADGGIGRGVMAEGGKVWQDSRRLGSVVATGLRLRKQFAGASLLFCIPVLLFLLRNNGASWLMASLVSLSVIPAFVAALYGHLLQVAPKLKQDLFPIQQIQVETNTGRLGLTAATLFLFPFAALAILCSGIAQVYGNWRLRRVSRGYADWTREEDPKVRARILKVVRKMLPESIYYCFSGQITVWLIAVFGSAGAVAQIGALGRLAAVLGVSLIIFNTLIVPRFARLPEEKNRLIIRFLQVLGLVGLSGAVAIGLAWLFPAELLLVLGSNYSGLEYELSLMITGSVIHLATGCLFSMNAARAIIVRPSIYIPATIIVQVLSILTFDVSTLTGVILISISVAVVQFGFQLGNFFFAMSKP